LILVDTAIWVDFLHRGDDRLQLLLDARRVLSHPFVIGELATGSLRRRASILQDLRRLPTVETAKNDEVLSFIDRHALFGRGLSYIDAHLLASAKLTADARIWTRDRSLRAAAERLDLCAHMDQ